MDTLTGRDLLEVGDATWLYDDAVLHGLHTGEWQQLERRIAQGITALARVQPSQASVDEELLRFRRARRLLAGEDLRDWLAERDLGNEDLVSCARRAVAVRADEVSETEATPTEIAAVLRAEAIYDGTFATCADALARSAAAAAALRASGDEQLPDVAEADVDVLVAAALRGPARGLARHDEDSLRARARAVLEVIAAHAAFAASAATPERTARLLHARRLDLTHVRFDDLRLDSRDAACEALMCVREDGLGLPQIAARARTTCGVQEGEIAELDAGVRAGVSGARPGDVVGPLHIGEHWRLLVVRDRVAPSLDDPATAARLGEELVAARTRSHGRGKGALAWESLSRPPRLRPRCASCRCSRCSRPSIERWCSPRSSAASTTSVRSSCARGIPRTRSSSSCREVRG